jgi:ribonuclease HI
LLLETIEEGHLVSVYSDSSYLVNCMRRGWPKKWRHNRWLTHRKIPVTKRDLWERLLKARERYREVRWRKVKGHSKTVGSPHKSGDDRADELIMAATRREKATVILERGRGVLGCSPCCGSSSLQIGPAS